MLSRLAGATYDPSATCPLWMTFLEQITVGDTDLADFLQLAVGYTLYGHTNEQVMFILIGSGGNGKGVFTRIIYSVLGEFSAVMQSNLLKPGAISANNPSPALMQLGGKRFWACSEVPKGMILDEGLTKQLTGGDLISSRGLYSNQVEFLPVGKLMLSVNDMPRVRHDDQGMWRRIVAIPFNAVFSGIKRDNSLEHKLKAELPGILNWALEGARKYAEKGKLGRPKASRKLLASLRRDADTVSVWIGSCCLEDDDGKLQSKAGYDSYVEAMKREKSTALSQKEFKADLERRGYAHKSGGHFNYHQGLTIKPD
jgi:P4 family phage/plasmid primase-like protien